MRPKTLIKRGKIVKILFTSPIIEHPAAGGPQLRIENSIKALSKVSELYVVSRSTKWDTGGDDAVNFYSSLVKNFCFAPSVNGLSKNRYISKLQRIFRFIKKPALEQDIDCLVNIIDREKIEIIWFGYGNITFDLIKLLKKTRPNLKIVCDTDSVWSRFLLRELPYETDERRIAKIKKEGLTKEKEEQEWVNICDITTAVSEVDADYYKNLASDPSRVMLFSNVIDMNSYTQEVSMPVNIKTPNIYLAGSFGPKSAMDKAARWFIEDIYPIIKKEIPRIHFYIIGRGSKETLLDIKDESISILGKVESVLPYLKYASVSLVPLKFESGTRFKIMEAAACKIPIVSTELGAEGIPITDGVDILISDEANEFAQSVIKIIKDEKLADHISENCFKLISEKNSVDSLTHEARKILKRLG